MGEGTSEKPIAATWPWFVLPHGWGVRAEAFHCAPPVLIASIPEETPGPSAAAADQAVVVEDEEEDESRPGPSKKWKREDKLISLIREDMRLQRETEARREWESAACMERLFSLLEKMSEHWLSLLLLFWVSFLFNLFIVNIHMISFFTYFLFSVFQSVLKLKFTWHLQWKGSKCFACHSHSVWWHWCALFQPCVGRRPGSITLWCRRDSSTWQ